MIKPNRKKESGLQKIHMVSCSRCGRIHPRGQCPVKKEPTHRNGPRTRTDIQRFRSTAAWQRKATEVKERDKYLCRLCLDEGYINNKNLSVHHIIPIAEDEDKRLDDDNLITLCEHHHQLVEGDSGYKGRLATLATSPPSLKG